MFYVIPMTDMLIFATLVFLPSAPAPNPPAHKRLILVATIALLIAAIARWPLAAVQGNPITAALLTYIFLLILAAMTFGHAQDSSRHSLGGSFPYLRAADKDPHRQDSRMARLCQLAQSLAR